MIIGFIGSGNVASHLGALFTQAGQTVVLGRREGSPSFTEAIHDADAVVIALPYLACATVLPAYEDSLVEKVVIDATNTFNPDYSPLDLKNISGAEHIAELLPRSRVVEAFNTIFADNMTSERLQRGSERLTAWIAGDDVQANSVVSALAHDAGFAPLEMRPLSVARHLEAMGHLLIANAFGMGRGTFGGFIWSER